VHIVDANVGRWGVLASDGTKQGYIKGLLLHCRGNFPTYGGVIYM
jgi:hypothetical protein